jgi:hypothetical protein
METLLNGLTRWMVVLALMLAYWPFHARAADMTAALAPRAPALLTMDRTIYAANLPWKGAIYRFTVGTRSQTDAERSRFIAEISLDGKTWATCERQVKGETPFDTNSMLLRCEGMLFSPAAVTVKFVFGPTMDEPHLVVWTSARAIAQTIALVPESPNVKVKVAEAH